jgi:hypothetical protein
MELGGLGDFMSCGQAFCPRVLYPSERPFSPSEGAFCTSERPFSPSEGAFSRSEGAFSPSEGPFSPSKRRA